MQRLVLSLGVWSAQVGGGVRQPMSQHILASHHGEAQDAFLHFSLFMAFLNVTGGGVEWTPRETLKIESQPWPGPPPDGERAQEETKVLVLTECHFPT